MIASLEDIKKEMKDNYVLVLKYVRVGEEYRFAFAGEWHTPDHNMMVCKEETPTSAAYIKLYRDRLEVEGYSSTLHIGSAEDDEKRLVKLLLGNK